MLRTSSYTIYVDLPDSRDEVLLIHGYTGAYDRVSRPVARFLRSHAGKRNGNGVGTGDGALPRAETVEVLRRRGYLTDKTHEDEEALVGRMGRALHEHANRHQPGYVFMPTYSCNLRCSYCFQSHMRSDPGYSHLLRTMTPEVVDRIFAAMPGIEERHGLDPAGERDRGILFFGGEPLLAANRPIVEYIFRKGQSLNRPKFSAISNGTEIEAYRDLLGPDKISFLQITLDGVPAEHDRKRCYAGGAGTFEKIAANIDMALELGVRISARINLDRHNAEGVPALVQEIDARGWRQSPLFLAYVAAIHSARDAGPELMDSWVLRKQVSAMGRRHAAVRRLGHLDDSLRGRLRKVFEDRDNPTPSFKATFCAAHTTMYIFDPFADVYACWEHTGDPDFRIARVAADGEVVFAEERRDAWRNRNILSNPVCRRCRYAFYCGGGCANLAMGRTGDLDASFCDGFAHRFRATAAKTYLDFLAGKTVEETQEPACDR